MDVQTRIRNAFLSEKNAKSVFDQILSEIETKCSGPDLLFECYTEETLRNFQVSMMRYLWTMCSPQLQQAHLACPKKTVFMLNALTLRRVVRAVITQIKNRPTATVGLMPSFPVIAPTSRGRAERFAPVDSCLGGSVPIGYLSSPRCRTVPIAKLNDEPEALHVWWTRPDKRSVLEAKYAQEIGFHLPNQQHMTMSPENLSQKTPNSKMTHVDIDLRLPWKYVTIQSEARSFGCPDAYTISVPEMTNLHRVCLHRVDIPLHVPGGEEHAENDDIKRKSLSFFYFSEDDEPMHVIELDPEKQGKTLIALLQDEMDHVGRHAYSLTIDTQTQRLSILQIAASGGKPGQFEIYFEQTKDNCAELLGFQKRNYQGNTKYEGSDACACELAGGPRSQVETDVASPATVTVCIPQLSSQPIIKLLATPGDVSRKRHEFQDYVLHENSNLAEPLNIASLSVAFYMEDGVTTVVGEHQLVFKCWYQVDTSVVENVSMEENVDLKKQEGQSCEESNPGPNMKNISTLSNTSNTSNDICDDNEDPKSIQTQVNSAVQRSAPEKPRRRKLPPLNLNM